MARRSVFKEKAIFVTWAVTATACLGLIFIADHQARSINKALKPKARIAVFMVPGTKVSQEVLREKLINIDGVAAAEFVAEDKVLEMAQNDTSPVKGLVLSGENPFSPYFLVEPARVRASFAEKLAELAGKMEGVDAVVYDITLFRTVERSGYMAIFYKTAGYAVLAVFLLLIVLKFFFRWLKEEADFLKYFFNIMLGVLTGFTGAGIFYLVTVKILQADVLRLPFKYLPLFMVGGMLVIMLGENDER